VKRLPPFFSRAVDRGLKTVGFLFSFFLGGRGEVPPHRQRTINSSLFESLAVVQIGEVFFPLSSAWRRASVDEDFRDKGLFFLLLLFPSRQGRGKSRRPSGSRSSPLSSRKEVTPSSFFPFGKTRAIPLFLPVRRDCTPPLFFFFLFLLSSPIQGTPF